MIENYRQQSASGISVAFLLVWMVGDITNLAGAIWAGLVPTVIALAIYFCFADAVLLSQCFYYNTINARRERRLAAATTVEEENGQATEDSPLLRRSSSDVLDNIGLPGSRRRSSAASTRSTRHSAEGRDSLAKILEEEPGQSVWLKNTFSVVMILIAGAAGWAIAWRTGAWRPTSERDSDDQSTPLGAEILGYASAVCYLGYVVIHATNSIPLSDLGVALVSPKS